MSNDQDDLKIDFASVFPAKGDARRPPEWYGRALLYTAIAVFLAYFGWRSWGKVSGVVLDVVISLFLALAIEPVVLLLVRHGWKRGVASAVSLIGLGAVIVALLALFGNMFVQQAISMVKGLPGVYDEISRTVEQYTSFKLPEIQNLGSEIFNNIQTSWVTDFAGQALSTTMGLFGFLLDLLTAVMVTYYLSAAGPKLRRSLCQWLGPATQRRFLLGWTIVQDQISNFLFSRTILAAINAACTAVFLDLIHVPYWLPLALFCGIVSQFIPTVGTYIGGALPVLFAWGSNGIMYAVGVLVYIVVYQQIENLILSPKISQRTMDLNPAVAFLALPITASLQAIFKVYTIRYELVDSPLMNDPKPVKKSKIVAGAEAFSDHVIKPMSDHMPRAARGSSARVPSDDNFERLRELYQMPTAEDLDGSQTVAIPKRVPPATGGKPVLSGAEPDNGDIPEPDDGPEAATAAAAADRGAETDGTDVVAPKPNIDNPRSGWR